MLSSIHPLGERARGNRWITTALWYTAGSVAGGALFGAAIGAGAAPLAHRLPDAALAVTSAACISAAVLADRFVRRRPWGWRRQVNEDWLGRYRAWLYGSGFGFQLGLAVVTIITTYAIYAYIVMIALTGSVTAGAAVGATFGLARALPVLATGPVRRPQQLRTFHRRLQASAPLVQWLSGVALLVVAGVTVAAR